MTRRFASALAAAVLLAPVAAPAAATDHLVNVRNFVFEPAALTIEVGDTVTWINRGGLHNVNAPGHFRCANGCDGEGGNGDPATNPWSFTRAFTTPEVIDYACEVHVSFGMTGQLTIVEAAGLQLEITGTCPGPVTIAVTGGIANSSGGLIFSRNPGMDPLPAGPCIGLATGLDNPALLAPISFNAQGEVTINATAPAGACGTLIQAVDIGDCSISNVAVVPPGAP